MQMLIFKLHWCTSSGVARAFPGGRVVSQNYAPNYVIRVLKFKKILTNARGGTSKNVTKQNKTK